MTRFVGAFIAVALMVAVPVMSRAVAAPLSVVKAWSRATAPGTSVGVAYFEIVNSGAADTLQSIESPAAGRVEMHLASTVKGMMQMREMNAVDIPAGSQVRFEPGGLHAMLMDLHGALAPGEHITLRLIFAHAGTVQVDATIAGIGAVEPPAANQSGSATQSYRLAAWPRHASTPGFHLIDADGQQRTLDNFRGQVLVVFFGFMHCPDACPAELYKLSLAMKRLGALRERVQVLFITLDPTRDRGPQLKSYVRAFDPRFIGLTGTAAQIDDAANRFAVEYAKVGTGANYSIDHSTATFVFDANGELRLVGSMDTSVGDYSHDLAALAAAGSEVSPRMSERRANP